MRSRQIEQIAFARDPLAVHDVELDLAKRWCDLVLCDFHLGAVARNAIAILDSANPPYIKPQRRIKLQSASASRRFGTAKHYTDLLPDLIDEDKAGVGLRYDRSQFAQCLGH